MTFKLAVRHLLLARGGRVILDIPELGVAPGEVLAVVGPNGAGKSSLLRVMALLERPTRGEVLMDGRPVRGDPLPYRRRMAVVFQEPLLLDTTVEANVTLGLALRGVPRHRRQERARHWLERLGIAHLAKRSVRFLSVGEAQRVSLARAFALAPEVLLLDEPFSALDAPTRQSLLGEVESLLRETATTTVLVTHQREEALRLGQRVAVLIEGRIRQVGPPQAVFSRPADAAVAAFLGVENILPGRVREVQGGLAWVEVGPHTLAAPADHLPEGGQVWACVRPEHVALAPAQEAAGVSPRNRLRGVVRALALEGAQVRVEVDCGFPVVAYVTLHALEELALAPGREVTVLFKALSVHLVPREGPP